MAARRPGTRRSRVPVRGSIGPSSGSYGQPATSSSEVSGLSSGSDSSLTDCGWIVAAPSATSTSSSARKGDMSAIPAREPTQAALETQSTCFARV